MKIYNTDIGIRYTHLSINIHMLHEVFFFFSPYEQIVNYKTKHLMKLFL